MRQYFDDSPIKSNEEDLYGIRSSAETLAEIFLGIKDPVGTTIALQGPWGSGKSSMVNLVRSALEKAREADRDSDLVVMEFKCWWYRGEEALVVAFLQQLYAVLGSAFGKKARKLVRQLGRGMLATSPVIGAVMAMTPLGAAAGLFKKSVDAIGRLFSDKATLEDTFEKLAGILEKEKRRFLVIIDDMDRLAPEEALAIFRLIRTVGHLPNVMYLVVVDRQRAEKAVSERYPSEGPHFLEKIIQYWHDVPSLSPNDLYDAVRKSISEICGEPGKNQRNRFEIIFREVVAPYITSPRDVNRFKDAIHVMWPAIAGNVNLADFIALEILRLYEPTLFAAIKSKKHLVCSMVNADVVCEELSRRDANGKGQDLFAVFLRQVKEEHRDRARTALQQLFPRLEGKQYPGKAVGDFERRVCIESHFDTYFRLFLSDETLSMQDIDELIDKAADRDFIQALFRQAATVARRTGSSMVPLYLDALIAHAKRIDKTAVEPLLKALFEIYDEIDQKKDAGWESNGYRDKGASFIWLIRSLMTGRFTIEERTHICLEATATASLGGLAIFVFVARGEHRRPEGGPAPVRPEDCLTTEAALPELTRRALKKIRAAAADGSLLHHKNLHYILCYWVDFMDNDPSEVQAWADKLASSDLNALVALARAIKDPEWAIYRRKSGTPEHHVANVFRKTLENIRDSDLLSAEEKESVRVFLTDPD